MKNTVLWKPRAQNDLALFWSDALPGERAAITAAANRLDQLLAHDPETIGESRPGDRRILFVAPLAVIFTIAEPDRRVDVLSVRRVPRRNKP